VVHLEEPGTFLGAHEGVPEAQFITYTAVARRVICFTPWVHPVEATKNNVGSAKQQHGRTLSISTEAATPQALSGLKFLTGSLGLRPLVNLCCSLAGIAGWLPGAHRFLGTG
jgi:hypothetical protein